MENNEICKSVEIDLDRVYFEMNSLLNQTNYVDCFGKEKRDIFLNTLKLYLLGKINETGITSFNEDSNVLDMVRYISSTQANKERLYALVHYLISKISEFQGWEVIWELNDNFGVEERCLHTHSGILNKFETGKDCDIYKSFAILYCFFTDSLVLQDDIKRLELN